MEKYTLHNDLRSVDFHDSCLTGAERSGDRLRLTFTQAVVIGHSCPELKSHIPCPLNRGEDRYAAPRLMLELREYRIRSILCGGCWSRDDGGGYVEKYPPRLLEPAEYDGLWENISASAMDGGNFVCGLQWDGENKRGNLSFVLNRGADYYEAEFTAGEITARWERYGDIAWYVEEYRRRLRSQQGWGDGPVYGAIDKKSHKAYTWLSQVFTAIGNAQLDYNWLITDCECYPETKEIEELLSREYCWLTGEALTELVEKEDFQWIWGVLSGFRKEITLEEVLACQPLPVSDGYSGFWQEPISLQHPLADVEIVPWDSSLVLVISKNEKLVSDFRQANPESRDLSEYNA